MVTITAKPNASSRTKNRLREHGNEFIIKDEVKNHVALKGHAVLLVAMTSNASDGKGGKEPWMGWLPVKEIDPDRMREDIELILRASIG